MRKPSPVTLTLAAILLSIATLVLHQNRFTFGPELLPPLDSATIKSWDISHPTATTIHGPSSLTLKRPPAETKGYPNLRYLTENPKDVRYLLAQARIKTGQATQGHHDFMNPRVTVAGYTKDKKGLWKYPHTLISKTGTSPWTRGEAVFEVFPDMAYIGYNIQHYSPSGSFSLDSISLRPAYQRPFYGPLIRVTLFLWIILIFLITSRIHQKKKSLIIVLHTLLLLTAFYLTVLPGANRIIHPLLPSGFTKTPPPALTQPSAKRIQPSQSPRKTPPPTQLKPSKPAQPKIVKPPTQLPPKKTPSPPPTSPKKAIPTPEQKNSLWKDFMPNKKNYHLFLFAFLTLTSSLLLKHPKTALILFLTIAILSEATQALQTKFPRHGDLLDLLLNISGVLLGIALYLLLKKILPRYFGSTS